MQAALYTRSSKDAHDVSLAAQSRELEQLASARQLTITHRFEDAVRSGSTDDRPGFQALINAIKDPGRRWTRLLVYDTSRIARGRYIAQAFKHQCRRLGVEILYAKVPETDPVSAVILDSVFEAMDEVHSIMSREKGLAGMRENVRRGFRAGGRAPWGYALQHHATGAIRQGKPVLKSTLVTDHLAPLARAYLQARARGVPRTKAARDLGVTLAASTLVSVEWNALVYAGHTVWNRHTEKASRGTGRPKRRNREDWEIRRDTHQALITDAEAEALLSQLELSDMGAAVSRGKAAVSAALLTGLLETTDGRRWTANGRYYRLKGTPGRAVPAEALDEQVLQRIRADVQDQAFAEELAAAVRADARRADVAPGLQADLARLERERRRAALLALKPDGAVYEQLAGELGRQIAQLKREAVALTAEDHARAELRSITGTGVRQILLGLDSPRALLGCVQRVELNDDLTCRLHYGLSMASPQRLAGYASGVVRVIGLAINARRVA